jgi:hypothetical protein
MPFHLGQVETLISEWRHDHGGAKKFLDVAQFHATRDGVAAYLRGRGDSAARRRTEIQADQVDAPHRQISLIAVYQLGPSLTPK